MSFTGSNTKRRRGEQISFENRMKISATSALTSLYSFASATDGQSPGTGLVQGGDGSFYGTTSNAGASGSGTVFRLTIVPLLFEYVATFPMGVVSGLLFFLQHYLPLSSRNLALVHGEHFGSRTEIELNRNNESL